MTVEVDAKVMIGLWFDSLEEATKWASQNLEDFDQVKHEDGLHLEECLPSPLECEPYSCFRNGGWCIGMHVGEDDFDPTGYKIFGIYQTALRAIPRQFHGKVGAHIWAMHY